MTTAESPYRRAERELGSGTDELWEHLEEHRYEDPTLMIGWAIERAKRFFNLDQAAVAEKTAVYSASGDLLEAPISKSFVSAMLSARSRVSPEVYKRLARAMDVNVIDFHIAEGWTEQADIGAYHLGDQEIARPIVQRILRLPREQRSRAVGVVTAVLDSIVDIGSSLPTPLKPGTGTD